MAEQEQYQVSCESATDKTRSGVVGVLVADDLSTEDVIKQISRRLEVLSSDVSEITDSIQRLKKREDLQDQNVQAKFRCLEKGLIGIAHQALATAMDGALKKVEEDYEGVCKRVDRESEKLKGVSTKVNRESDKLEHVSRKVNEDSKKLEGLSEKVDDESKKLEDVSKKVNQESEKLKGVSRKVDEKSEKLDQESRRLDSFTEKVDQVDGTASDLSHLSSEVSELKKRVKELESYKRNHRRSSDRLDNDGNTSSYENFITILIQLIDKFLLQPNHPPPPSSFSRSRSRSYSFSVADSALEDEVDDVFGNSVSPTSSITRNSTLNQEDKTLLINIRRMLSDKSK